MNNYERYLVTRPLFARFDRENGMPVIRKCNIDLSVLEEAKVLNFSNLAKHKKDSIVVMFHHDKKINCLWNNPLKYVNKFKDCLAVLTPDYTIQRTMDEEMIRMNTYRNRWLGCTWQQFGVKIIPTISWADENTYDICFSGIEYGSIVAISTLGCLKNGEQQVFLKGYRELIKRKNPSLILVFGTIIKGMKGTILPLSYSDGFLCNNEYEQLSLFNMSKIIVLREGD
ncbi:MAG: DUF4417 domain-containing protein [Clostridia bacterium]|nr:DUF4417 domain-containing protein [Clostridia bacterium]